MLSSVSDYMDYNTDDGYDEPTYIHAAPIQAYGAPAQSYGAPSSSYGAPVAPSSSYGAPAQHYSHTEYQTSYQAVPIPVAYDDYDYEESFASKFAKGWEKAKDTLYSGYEDATKAVKGLFSYDDYDDGPDYIYYEVPATGYHHHKGGYGAPGPITVIGGGGHGGGGKGGKGGKGFGKGGKGGKGGGGGASGHYVAPAIAQPAVSSYSAPAVASSYGAPPPIVHSLGHGSGSSYAS